MTEYLYLHNVHGIHMTDEEVCDLIEDLIKRGLFEPDKLKIGTKARLDELQYLSTVVN